MRSRQKIAVSSLQRKGVEQGATAALHMLSPVYLTDPLSWTHIPQVAFPFSFYELRFISTENTL
eukprot:m.12017 g.12017  ORF g.12017 m.12017 type:complete len:64 (+) comp4504_c0_seq1:2618-2809(+)